MSATEEAVDLDRLLEEHPVMDGHNDLLWTARRLTGYDFAAMELDDPEAGPRLGTHTDLPRLRAGGVGAQFWSVFVPATLSPADALTATLEQVDAAYAMVERYADRLGLATGADDVEEQWRRGRIASLMGAEGGHQIGCSLGTLRMLHRLGVRYLTLTHNDNVPWADSATDEPRLGGLSAFGREVVREMNRIGMLVDLSHVSADVMRQALEVSEVPVIFSHSSAREICPVPRNVPDDVLGSLADNGGVCMVTFVPRFVTPAVAEYDETTQEIARERGIEPTDLRAYNAVIEERLRTDPPPPSTLADVVAHVEHVREVAGIDHVGIGGDYDGTEYLPQGLEDVGGYPRLLAALVERGWSADDLAKLTCRNVLRALRDAEQGAAALQEQRGPSLATWQALDGDDPAHPDSSARSGPTQRSTRRADGPREEEPPA